MTRIQRCHTGGVRFLTRHRFLSPVRYRIARVLMSVILISASTASAVTRGALPMELRFALRIIEAQGGEKRW
jgi:hypothetical protein